MIKKIILGAAALTATATALPAAAEARGYYGDGYRYSRHYNTYQDPYYRGGQYDPYYRGGRYDSYHRGSRYDPYRRSSYYDRGYYDRGYSQGYYGRSYGYRDPYYSRRSYRRCGSGTGGAIVGGAAGALLGREIARGRGYYRRGGGTTGALIGGAAGALIGREIGRSC